jgi:hypothetical protein
MICQFLKHKMPMSFQSASSNSKKNSPFEDDCERPACEDIKKALPNSLEDLQAMSQKLAAKKKLECPPRSAELGRSSWKLLHSMVRFYCKSLSKEVRIYLFSLLY